MTDIVKQLVALANSLGGTEEEDIMAGVAVIKNLNASCKHAERMIYVSGLRLGEMSRKNAQLRAEVEQLQIECTAHEAYVAHASNNNDQLRAEIEQLRSLIGDLNAERVMAKAEVERLRSNEHAQTSGAAALLVADQKLRTENDIMRRHLNLHPDKPLGNELRAENERLKAELEDEQQYCKAGDELWRQVDTKVAKLRAEIERLKAENTVLRAQLDVLQHTAPKSRSANAGP